MKAIKIFINILKIRVLFLLLMTTNIYADIIRVSDPLNKWKDYQEGSNRVNTPELRDGLVQNLSPAEIIYYTSIKENPINPVLVLTKLQDEQSLIQQDYTGLDLEKKLLRSLGYGSYNSGDTSQWYGFYPQVVSMTYQFYQFKDSGKSFKDAYNTYTQNSTADKYSEFIGKYSEYEAVMNNIAHTKYKATNNNGGYYNDFSELSVKEIQLFLDQFTGVLKNKNLFKIKPYVNSFKYNDTTINYPDISLDTSDGLGYANDTIEDNNGIQDYKTNMVSEKNYSRVPKTKMFDFRHPKNNAGTRYSIVILKEHRDNIKFKSYYNLLGKPFRAGGVTLYNQCTSYTWSRFAELYKLGVYNKSVFDYVNKSLTETKISRNAKNWKDILNKYTVIDMRYEKNIEAGQIITWGPGNYGHVGIIEEVNRKENYFKISEANWFGYSTSNNDNGNYSERYFPIYDTKAARMIGNVVIPATSAWNSYWPDVIALPRNKFDGLFYDVTKNNWYYTYIKTLIDQEIIRGQGGYFYPDNKITQFEFLAILNKLFFKKEFATYIKTQSNPTDQHNHFNFRNTILNYETKDNPVSREDVADVLYQVFQDKFNLPAPNLTKHFQVWEIANKKYLAIIRFNDDWNYTSSFLKAIRVSKGYADGTYGLKNSITRAEASVLLVKAYKFLEANK